jgi:beta-glucosidase
MDIERLINELTLEEKAALCSGKDYSHTKKVDRLGIPGVAMCDGPHGLRKQKGDDDQTGIRESIDAVCFPTGSALAASFDRDLLYRVGEVLGEECQVEGIAMLQGPGINIKRSPLCGRNFEYFSEDPCLTGQLAAAYIRGLQSKGVASCAKHFAANNQETRRMSSTSQVDERTLHEIYLPAFEAVVKEGKTRAIMSSYNAINGTAASEHRELLKVILREKWGFTGMVVSDWCSVNDRVNALRAGLDLEMPGPGTQDAKIVDAVKNGSLDMTVLDRAVRTVLKFSADYENDRQSAPGIDLVKDHALAAEFSKECAVLLKNSGAVLPLEKTARVAFIGECARSPWYQGSGSSHINVQHPISALEAAAGLNIVYAQGYRAGEESPDPALADKALAAAKSAAAAVIFAGLPDGFETEGADRPGMSMPDNQNRLIAAVAAVQPNTIVVLHGGAPVEIPWAAKVPAILNMYLGGDGVGRAAVELLFGDANPSGKLSETYPLKVSDNPSYLNFPGEKGVVEYREGIYVGYRYYDKKEMEVRFPFGHGLSYTSFAYSDLMLDKKTMADTETLIVMCKVKNTGSRAGKESVQLYVRDKESSVGRPLRELKDFAKITLESGEEKQVIFKLNKRSFAYYEPAIHDWFVESGIFVIEIGASSRDIRLHSEVDVQGTSKIPVHFTEKSTVGDLASTKPGQVIIESAQNHIRSNKDLMNLGAGTEQRLMRNMLERPLFSMLNTGSMTEAALNKLLASVNGSQDP